MWLKVLRQGVIGAVLMAASEWLTLYVGFSKDAVRPLPNVMKPRLKLSRTFGPPLKAPANADVAQRVDAGEKTSPAATLCRFHASTFQLNG
jgi:hypothetical protein